MNTALLEEFIQRFPVCPATANLKAVLELFAQTAVGLLVIVNEQNTPVEIIRFSDFAPYLSANLVQDLANQQHFTLDLEQSIAQWQTQRRQESGEILYTSFSGPWAKPLIKPLIRVPITVSLEQLQVYLQASPQPDVAVVDRSNQYLGLIDRDRVWQWWANTLTSSHTPKTAPSSHPMGKASRPWLQSYFRSHMVSLLIDVLEQIPLPMMLQLESSQILAQNLAWRDQLGDLQDPYALGRQSPATLEKILGDRTATGLPAAHLSSAYYPELLNTSAPLNPLGFTSARQTSECRLGTDPNSCVCIYPVKNGQERVWQFIKIPLNSIFLESPLDQSQADAATEYQQNSLISSLELSSLVSQPIPHWLPEMTQTAIVSAPESLWLVLAQDTTEQQQVARELAAKNADLVQLNRLKDEFLACITHELKTPLTSILGLSSLLKDQLLGPLNDRQIRYTHLIHQGGRHLISIVNDILDLTRIETGQLELTLEPTDVHAVCQYAYDQARRLFHTDDTDAVQASSQSVDVSFTLEIAPHLASIVADELRLRQMLTHLVSNALKFTPKGGKIGIEVDRWDGWIAFTVWDTGIGIPIEKQHLIFQKFQQLENPLTRRYEGTGLGLVLTQRLARLHGGDVTFTSMEEKGSRFTLLLPPSPPRLRTKTLINWQGPSSSPSSRRLVLVVEAVPQFLDHLTQQLTGLGYRVAIARSGTEALEKTRRLQPVAVFINPLLPLLSGWDVLTLLKSNPETQSIPAIITATQIEKNQAQANGADGFLSFPTETELLSNTLEQLIRQAVPDESEHLHTPLTILHLQIGSSSEVSLSDSIGAIADFNALLHPHHCRVLQVDDLDQADLLGRVWKPDLVLLDGSTPNPVVYLKQLSQYAVLASLPIVTLSLEMTEAANQVPGLMVFPCLAPLKTDTPTSMEGSALWQVMQVAAGTTLAPHILIIDLASLHIDDPHLIAASELSCTAPTASRKTNEWLQALLQYIQTAGFRGSISYSWSEIYHQVEHQSTDLLLCIYRLDPSPSLSSALQLLAQRSAKPPLLVWNCQPDPFFSPTSEIMNLLEAIAVQILPASLSMQELLDHINHTLAIAH
jgi:signal transduction histidine kinase/DNA-binding response OmpR family regulator